VTIRQQATLLVQMGRYQHQRQTARARPAHGKRLRTADRRHHGVQGRRSGRGGRKRRYDVKQRVAASVDVNRAVTAKTGFRVSNIRAVVHINLAFAVQSPSCLIFHAVPKQCLSSGPPSAMEVPHDVGTVG
jgi:hypothetical protein